MSDKKKKGDEPGYAEASSELEGILHDIESGQIDLDVLTEKVERAAILLAICRRKLAATETKVKTITAAMAEADAGAGAGAGDAPAAGDADEEAPWTGS
ncbi:MAG: exodeoxyribonuclease VII small subunit [Planctomycetes bacterium]|nr:exodeoxyribonuclease VII small subunit [Planctomycetota bacterium]